MAEEDRRAPAGAPEGAECFLASNDADGSVRSIGPFPESVPRPWCRSGDTLPEPDVLGGAAP